MPDTLPVVPAPGQPPAPAAPAPDAAAAPEDNSQAPTAPQLPPDVLNIPFVQGLLAGAPVAVTDQLKAFDKKAVGKTVLENLDALQQAGFGFYKTMDGKRGVIFNQLHISPQDIVEADKAGKLHLIAPDLDQVDHEIGKSGRHNPLFKVSKVPGGVPTPASGGVAQQGSGQLPDASQGQPGAIQQALSQPAATSTQNKLLTARLKNLQPSAPTGGPDPGQGQILNAVQKQPI